MYCKNHEWRTVSQEGQGGLCQRSYYRSKGINSLSKSSIYNESNFLTISFLVTVTLNRLNLSGYITICTKLHWLGIVFFLLLILAPKSKGDFYLYSL